MRMFSEEVKHTFSNSPLNILQVADFSEIFFGVYEVEINKRKYPVEKISEHNGNPVVSVPVEIKGKKANYPFVLTKGNPEIIFNENSDYVEIFENSQNNQNIEEEIIQIEEDVEEIEIPNLENKKQKILEEIQKAKKKALIASKKEIERQKSQKIKQIREEKDLKEKALKNYLESARENLVGEFTNISQKIKNELISENDGRFSEIKDTIDNKIQDLADSLNESLKKDFNNSSKLIDKSIKQLVKDLYENNINPRVDKELNNIAVEIVEKVSEIDKNLNSKLDKKADISLIEGVEKELDSIRDSNIELNNSLNKGIQKALSRVGNVDKKIIDVSEKFERRVEKTEKDITSYFDEKINLLKEETLDITDEARLYFQNLIQESKNGLLSEIRKIKNEKPVEYILETKNGKSEVKDWDSIEKDWNKKIHDKIENVRTDLRKYVAVYASGGGTNAKQYANGGTMNGSLNVAGQILSGGVDLDDIFATKLQLLNYLPLSGGTMTGDINFASAGITNVDSITFNTALETVPNTGEIGWNNADGTLDVGLNNNVIVPIGEKEVVYVKAAEDIKNGQCVYASDASGGGSGNIIVSLFSAAGVVDELRFLGIATQDINANAFGYVATFGKIKNVSPTNTRGTDDPQYSLPANQGWVIGTILYVSATSPGKYTSVPPTPPNKRMPIALVIAENGNQRIIFARAEHGYDLNELHNVNIVNPQNNQILTYNKTLSTWNNTSNLNVTSLSATSLSATTIHALSSFVEVIDIKQYELSGFNVKGDATVQGSISATGNLVVDTDTLYVDSVNDRVGIGTANPSQKLEVVGASSTLYVDCDSGYYPRLFGKSTAGTTSLVEFTNGFFINNPSITVYNTVNTFSLVGHLNVNVGAPTYASILYASKTSQNVGIGTTTPSYKLDVNGDANISTSLTVGTSLDVGGHFSAVTKSFLINHPTKPGKKLQYGVVESDQHSVFVRGISTEDTIVLPEEWEGLVHEDSVTVQLTPVASYQQLYVVSQNNKQVVVGGVTGKYNYTIYGERKDVAKLETEV